MKVTFSPKWVNQAQFAGEFIAKDFGFYRQEGLDVAIKEFQLGGSVLQDLEQGVSQFGLMSANEFLAHVSEGKKIKAVAAFYQVSPFMVASLKRNPVISPAEFKGKKLGIKGGSGAEGRLVYELLLSSVGLSERDVTFVDLPLGYPEKDDLLSGKVDVVGFYRDQLYYFDQEEIAYEPIYPERYGSAVYNDILVVTEDFLQKHPDRVKAFLRATVQGWRYAYAHKETALSTTLRYVTAKNYTDIDYERYILNANEQLMTLNGSVKIGKMESARWEKFYTTLLDRGLIKKPFDIKTVVMTDFLPD